MGPFHLSNCDIRQLRVFAAIVEHEGLSAAAYALGVNLTYVSRSLADLENRLGMRLCQRGRGGFKLTPQGMAIYNHVKRLASEIDEFETHVRIIGQSLKGQVRIGVVDATIFNPMSRITASLKLLAKAHPDLSIDLSVAPQPTIEVAVRERNLDIGVLAQPAHLSPLVYAETFAEEQRVYIAKDHPLRDRIITAFVHQESIPGGIPYVTRRYKAPALDLLQQRYNLRTVSTVNSVEAAATMIAAGWGIGVLPTYYARLLAEQGLVEVPVPEAPIRFPLYLIHRSDSSQEPTTRTMRKYLLHHEIPTPRSRQPLVPTE